jgi:hypothetical protein
MESIVFDTGPMISLTLNNLLWVVEELKQKFKGDFYIPKSVKEELIDRPLTTKKYKLEAIQLLPLINQETIKVYDNDKLADETKRILEIVDELFEAKGNFVKAVHFADMQVIVAAKMIGANTVIIDEYTTRYLVEDPKKIAKRLEKKLHTKVNIDYEKLKTIQEYTKGIKVLRSFELITVAYELDVLDKYLFRGENKIISEPKKTLLEAALWGLKLNGCGVSEQEIQAVLELENTN